mmetsp:Transcript_18842/g.40626  ORF Transcript_18842/g.40626 Transcript_18842/m.40626 type:complete len:255 (+) Transcript_18842:51-815(+)
MASATRPLSGQVALVTGGGGGIGLAAATALADRGAIICLLDLNEKALSRAVASLSLTPENLMTIATDVTVDGNSERAVAAIVRRWSRIDILVQAAGITGATNLTTDKVDPSNFDKVLAVNLRGIFLMCRAVLQVMRERNYGRIVNIASIAGKEGNAGMLAYSTSKAGVIGLTKVVGKEFAETGITCNALSPAVVRTEMVAAMPDAQVKYMTDKIPMKRTGELSEIAAMICFMASPECSFTTGFCFDATGGRATY